jgi:hypothetical protein
MVARESITMELPLFVLNSSLAATLTLRALARACAVEALAAVTGPFTLNTLTGSTAHVALCSFFHGSLVDPLAR